MNLCVNITVSMTYCLSKLYHFDISSACIVKTVYGKHAEN